MIDDDTQTPPDPFDGLDPDVRRRIESEAVWIEHVLKLSDDFGPEALVGAVHVTTKRELQRIVVYFLATVRPRGTQRVDADHSAP